MNKDLKEGEKLVLKIPKGKAFHKVETARARNPRWEHTGVLERKGKKNEC